MIIIDKKSIRDYFRLWQTEDDGHLPLKNIIDKDSSEIPGCGTPWDIIDIYLNEIPDSVIQDPNTTWATDMPEVVHALVKERGVNPNNVYLDCDSDWKRQVAKTYKIQYNTSNDDLRRDVSYEDSDMKRQFTVNLINYKYTDIVDNSNNEKRSAPISRSDRVLNGLSYVKPDGYFGVIGTSQALLTAGQKSVLPNLLQYEILKVFAKLTFPVPLGVEVSGVILKKVKHKNKLISYVSINDEVFDIDIDKFVYTHKKGKHYIPTGVTKNTISLVEKIVAVNSEVFTFAGSTCKGHDHLVGFWGGRNVLLSPKHLKITNTGDFGANEKQSFHNCNLGQEYPEDNIRAVFQGKWFHWFLTQLLRKPGGNRPAGVSYFPKLDLSVKWTFDKLAQKIGASAEEKQIVLDWAKNQNEDWQD